MPVSVAWDNEDQTCILVTFEGNLTSENTAEGAQLLIDTIGNRFRYVDIIFNVHPDVRFPPFKTTDLRKMVKNIPTNPGIHVLVNAPQPMRRVAAIFGTLIAPWMGIELINAETLDEAREVIGRRARSKGE
jgi:hypothetical protein